LINHITGHKKARQGLIKGNSEERIEQWFNHFRNLLGKEPVAVEEEENIAKVLENLEIEDGNFTRLS